MSPAPAVADPGPPAPAAAPQRRPRRPRWRWRRGARSRCSSRDVAASTRGTACSTRRGSSRPTPQARGSSPTRSPPRRWSRSRTSVRPGPSGTSARTAAEAEAPPAVNTLFVRENGPYAVRAALDVGGDVSRYRATLCRCGQSKNKPYCDGSHVGAAFRASGEARDHRARPAARPRRRPGVHPAAQRPAAGGGQRRDLRRHRPHRRAGHAGAALPLRPLEDQALLRPLARQAEADGEDSPRGGGGGGTGQGGERGGTRGQGEGRDHGRGGGGGGGGPTRGGYGGGRGTGGGRGGKPVRGGPGVGGSRGGGGGGGRGGYRGGGDGRGRPGGGGGAVRRAGGGRGGGGPHETLWVGRESEGGGRRRQGRGGGTHRGGGGSGGGRGGGGGRSRLARSDRFVAPAADRRLRPTVTVPP